MNRPSEKELALQRKNRDLEERKRIIEEELNKLNSQPDDEDINFHQDYQEEEFEE